MSPKCKIIQMTPNPAYVGFGINIPFHYLRCEDDLSGKAMQALFYLLSVGLKDYYFNGKSPNLTYLVKGFK